MIPCLAMRPSVRLDDMRSEPSLESFTLLISNSAKKRLRGKKSQCQTKAGGNLLLPKATRAICASSHGCLRRSLRWESRFLPLAISLLCSEPHSVQLKLRVCLHPAGHPGSLYWIISPILSLYPQIATFCKQLVTLLFPTSAPKFSPHSPISSLSLENPSIS